jgi:hypothetical protein
MLNALPVPANRSGLHRADAHENARLAAGDPLRRNTGVLQCLPGHLKEQPLLRIHALGLARRDSEEASVESVDLR